MGQRKAVKPKAGGQQQQQQQQQLPVLQPVQAAAAAGGGGQPLHSPTGGAAAAGAGGVGGAPAVSLSTLQQLEEKKKRLRSQLKDVERQIYDLETRYLEGVNPNANALTGYEALRNGMASSAKPPGSRGSAVVEEDRIFSGSSTTAAAGQR